jgi:DNA-damage-inducible protein D
MASHSVVDRSLGLPHFKWRVARWSMLAAYRNFQAVIEPSRAACFNSGQRVDDHFVDVTDMIEVGKGAK